MRDDDGPDFTGTDGVRRLAELAALELTNAEVERLAAELEGILGHMEDIRGGGAEERGVGQMRGGGAEERGGAEGAPVGIVGLGGLRSDEPGADPLTRRPGEGAPDFDAGFFTVPRLRYGAEESAEGREGAEGREDAEGREGAEGPA